MSAALAIREELLSFFPPLVRKVPESAKVVAFKVGTTPRAVEAHRQQEQLPRLDVGLAYGRLYPEIRALYNRLMEAEMGDSGEDPRKLLNDIALMIQARVNMKAAED